MGRIATFLMAVPGGYLGDRFGRLTVVRVFSCFTLVTPFLIYANTKSYTVVLLASSALALLGGLAAASQAALSADVLPKNSDNAARDMQLIQAT